MRPIHLTTLRGLVWAATERFGSQVLQIITMAVLTRHLLPDAFGLLAMVQVFIVLCEMLIEQGLGQALVQRKDLTPTHLYSVFWVQLAIGFALMLAMISGAPFIALIYRQPEVHPILVALSPLFVLHALNANQRAILQRDVRMKRLAVRTLVSQFAGSGVGIIAAVTGWGVWSLVAQVITSRVTDTIVFWSMSSWRPAFRFDPRCLRQLIGFSSSSMGLQFVYFLQLRGMDFLIGYYLGARELGYFSVACRLLRALHLAVSGMVQSVMFPVLSRVQHDKQQLKGLFLTGTYFSAIIFLPVTLFAILYAGDVLRLVFGAGFVRIAPVFSILAIATLQSIFGGYNGTALRAQGKAHWVLALATISLVGNIGAFFITYSHGLLAIAAGMVVVSLCLSPMGFILLRRTLEFRYRDYALPNLRIAGLTAISAGVALLVRQMMANVNLNDTGSLVSALAGALIYTVFVVVLERPVRDGCIHLLAWIASPDGHPARIREVEANAPDDPMETT